MSKRRSAGMCTTGEMRRVRWFVAQRVHWCTPVAKWNGLVLPLFCRAVSRQGGTGTGKSSWSVSAPLLSLLVLVLLGPGLAHRVLEGCVDKRYLLISFKSFQAQGQIQR